MKKILLGKNKKNNKEKLIVNCLKYIKAFVLFGLLFVIIMPFVKILIDSIKGSSDTEVNLVYWIPANPTFSRIRSAFINAIFNQTYLNTFVLCLITSNIQVIMCGLFGYTFALLKFKGSNILFAITMFVLFVPRESMDVARTLFMTEYPFLGIYLMKSKSSIFLMTLFGMGYFSPIFIFLFRQYFKSVSLEIKEQAYIDGASVIKTFTRIMLPNAKGAIITTFIMTFVYTYNDSYFPSLFNFSTNNYPVLSMGLINRRYANINTTALVIIVPLLIIYVLIQKFFIDSIEKSILC